MSYLGKYQDPKQTKATAKALQNAIDRLPAIERERFDVSYRDHKPAPTQTRDEVNAKTEELLVRMSQARGVAGAKFTAEQNRIIWNAGRYAQGARDKDAVAAHKKLLEATKRGKK